MSLDQATLDRERQELKELSQSCIKKWTEDNELITVYLNKFNELEVNVKKRNEDFSHYKKLREDLKIIKRNNETLIKENQFIEINCPNPSDVAIKLKACYNKTQKDLRNLQSTFLILIEISEQKRVINEIKGLDNVIEKITNPSNKNIFEKIEGFRKKLFNLKNNDSGKNKL